MAILILPCGRIYDIRVKSGIQNVLFLARIYDIRIKSGIPNALCPAQHPENQDRKLLILKMPID